MRSRRRRAIEVFTVALRIARDEGLGGLLRKAFDRYVKRRGFFELGPDAQYQVWLENNELTHDVVNKIREDAARFQYQPKISIVMPVYNTNSKWLEMAINSVIRQFYPNWELCIADDASTRKHVKRILETYLRKNARIKVVCLEKNSGIAAASNAAILLANGEFVGFLDHDDELTPDALYEVVKVLNEQPDVDYIYTDEDKKDLKGHRVDPFFKPDWSPDLLLSMDYVTHFSVVRRSLLHSMGGFRLGFDGSQDYDLLLRVTERTNRIAHIAKPVYNWCKVPGSAAASVGAKPYARESAKKALREALNRRGLKGEVLDSFFGNHYRIRYTIEGSPLVSIIISTKDRVDLLKCCIESIESRTSYKNYEIVIIDNNSAEPNSLAYLDSLSHKVVRFNESFNFSRINNLGAKHAKGEHLLFLNNDVEVIDGNWLDAMLEHSQRPEVGIVGGLLLYPSSSTSRPPRTIQHAGVTMGVNGVASNAFRHLPADRSNYFGLHRVVRNCSAVTAACAMTRRSVFEDVGGFDENLRVAYGDIDLCLRVREKGYRVVYTPYAMLYHHESATRGELDPSEDEIYMINRWGDVFIKGDPYYNPNLTLLREDHSLSLKGSSIRPLATLLDIYHLRRDLQRAYPEARSGDYRRLVDWAAITGTTVDPARVPLLPYGSYYASNASDRVRPIATLINLYNSRIDLQRRYPEVLKGDLRRLIAGSNDVLFGAEHPRL
jgi:GT2 family glycosyltransferase